MKQQLKLYFLSFGLAVFLISVSLLGYYFGIGVFRLPATSYDTTREPPTSSPQSPTPTPAPIDIKSFITQELDDVFNNHVSHSFRKNNIHYYEKDIPLSPGNPWLDFYVISFKYNPASPIFSEGYEGVEWTRNLTKEINQFNSLKPGLQISPIYGTIGYQKAQVNLKTIGSQRIAVYDTYFKPGGNWTRYYRTYLKGSGQLIEIKFSYAMPYASENKVSFETSPSQDYFLNVNYPPQINSYLTAIEDTISEILSSADSDNVLAASSSNTVNNSPPDNGYRLQTVDTGSGKFVVQIVAADSSSTRVVVDTASSQNCSKDCPVLPLKDYVKRNNALAAINGSYFCPAAYPSCADKKNSFDLLLMNKDKRYFNSDNNVYSSNPGFIFGGSYVRFVRSVSEWGRDTNIDGMISNFPALVQDGQNIYGGSSDSKLTARGPRGFVANKGNRIYIGVVKNATVSESARVLATLGVDNAMNLDSGGSTALWYKGYKSGPGRAIPNAILFVPR